MCFGEIRGCHGFQPLALGVANVAQRSQSAIHITASDIHCRPGGTICEQSDSGSNGSKRWTWTYSG